MANNDTSTNNESSWSKHVDNVKDRASNSLERMSRAPRQAVDGIKQDIDTKAEGLKRTINKPIDSVKHKYNKARFLSNEIKSADGFKNKAGILGKAAKNKVQNFDFYKKAQESFRKIQNTVTWISAHAYPLLITTVVILVIHALVIFAISVSQSISPTPHYYCDIDADASLKATSVYQQYCGDAGVFNLENLNGHYIIQDGSGPCTDASTANMLMRYYTSKGINFFDYLWDEHGQYSSAGMSLLSSNMGSPTNLRHHINGTTTYRSDCFLNRRTPNGATEFAAKNGVPGWNMANWGYLRDDSLDLKQYEETSDYYVDNASNENWVFDLSIPNNGPGSSWAAIWQGELTIEGIRSKEVTFEGESVTGETIDKMLNDTILFNKAAGVLLYYQYGGSNRHAILITKHEDGTWYGVDPALGLAGGYEGPMDDSGHFVWQDKNVKALLDSNQHSYGGLSIVRICAISNL